MEQSNSQKKVNEKSTSLNVASTLCWTLGILNLIGGTLAIKISTVEILFSIVVLIIGIILCIAGYGLRKKQRSSGVMAIISSIFSLSSPPGIGLIMGMVIIVLTIKNWKKLN